MLDMRGMCYIYFPVVRVVQTQTMGHESSKGKGAHLAVGPYPCHLHNTCQNPVRSLRSPTCLHALQYQQALLATGLHRHCPHDLLQPCSHIGTSMQAP